MSLLVASLAFSGERLDEARLGVLATVIFAPVVAWLATRALRLLPTTVRARQIGRTADDILDLTEDVAPERDHIRGSHDAPVTLVEYGDFECPYCGQAERVIRELLSEHGDDVRYVWRHLPLNDVHPDAQLAAEGSEAAAAQGKFWEMYDTLLAHQDELSLRGAHPLRRQARFGRRPVQSKNSATGNTLQGSARTSRAPTRVACPARPRSSSTAGVTTASTTSTRSQARSKQPRTELEAKGSRRPIHRPIHPSRRMAHMPHQRASRRKRQTLPTGT